MASIQFVSFSPVGTKCTNNSEPVTNRSCFPLGSNVMSSNVSFARSSVYP